MTTIQWSRYPLTADSKYAREWLQIQAHFSCSSNTIDAYARALNDFFQFCRTAGFEPETARKVNIVQYIQDLQQRRYSRNSKGKQSGLASATIKQRITIVRLYYDYLVEEDICQRNPASRSSHKHQHKQHRGRSSRKDLVVCPKKQPWIPNDKEWKILLQAVQEEPLRNRLMFALAYDGALRREEVCGLEFQDVNPADQLLTVRAEISKSYYPRVVPYSDATSSLFCQYFTHRRQLSRSPGPIFLSESRRNKGQPISIWTWSKVIEGIAERSGVHQFTTHTLRHLRLTDLARDGHSLPFIAEFAGHRNIETTQLYIHLSGREVAKAAQESMNKIHAWRTKMVKEALQ